MIRSIFQPLKFDWKVVTITIVSTLLLIIFSYHDITPYTEVDQTILFFFVPMIVILLIFRESPGTYGFTFGDWRAGSVITVGGILVMTPVIWFLARLDPSAEAYYEGMAANLPWNTFFQIF